MKNHQVKLIVMAALTSISLSVAARDGKHNSNRCYVTLASGTETSSPCSARGTTCNADFTCSIDGIPGIGKHRKGAQKARAKLQNKPTPKSSKHNKSDGK